MGLFKLKQASSIQLLFTDRTISINPTSISTKNVFHQMQGSFRSIFGLILSLFYVFATPPRFLSSFQLLVNNELFHQSSLYLKNIVSSVQLLFKKSYLHFSPGEKSGGKCPGGKCPRPF